LLAIVGCKAPTVVLLTDDAAVAPEVHDDVAAPDPVDPVFTRIAEAYCNVTAQCAPVDLATQWGSVDECMQGYPRFTAHLTSGWGVLATADQRRACADALATTDCAKAARTWIEGDLPAACRVPGALSLGASCASNWQCASMHCSGQCGVCVDPLPDGACTDQRQCPFGHLCVATKCVKPRELGEACDASTTCHLDLACQSGTCVRAPTQGETCLEGADHACARTRNLRCEPTTKQCVPWKIAKVGEPCGPNGDEPVPCERGLACKQLGPGLAGTCVTTHPDGTACLPAYYATPGGPCRFPSSCVRRVCRALELDDCSLPEAPP
jgi:hypothetical protein